ncbi:MAG: 2-oxo acid dehydrogenase subunit E2 [Chitinophagaceae bacterium]|nr:2-oxo acid dehydrogenase subunit E2 [Chitinophagaceae bacterium]
MAIVDLVMPKLGESIMEATILHWNKKPGEEVKMDETMLEIATDKVDSEVPSTVEGIVEELLYGENDVVPVGAVIAKIRANNGVEGMPVAGEPLPVEKKIAEKAPVEVPYQPVAVQQSEPKPGNVRFYSPLVLNIAANEGINLSELEKIPGTGNEGRVTKKDILQWVAGRREGGQPAGAVSIEQTAPLSTTASDSAESVGSRGETGEKAAAEYQGNVEVVEMDRMRKIIAKHMVESKRTSAHVTSFTECDVTNMVLWREKVKGIFEKQEGEKLTFTPLFIEAVVKCIKKFPWLNASVDGDKIIVRKDVNISMAAALPNGNLVTPVIRDADLLNLTGLAKKVNRLADAARNNRLRPDDTQNGTFTVTNVGTFGSLMGTPIINQPQVAILAIGAIKKRPVVVETEQGDSIAIRHMMYLSLSYDHRIVDGSLGSSFLAAVANEMENFDAGRSM